MAKDDTTADELSETRRADFKKLIRTPVALNGPRAPSPLFRHGPTGKFMSAQKPLQFGERP